MHRWTHMLVYRHVHTYMYTHTHTYKHVHIRIYTQYIIHTYVGVCIHTCAHAYTPIRVLRHIHTCAHTYTGVYPPYIHMRIYVYRHQQILEDSVLKWEQLSPFGVKSQRTESICAVFSTISMVIYSFCIKAKITVRCLLLFFYRGI